MKLARMEVSEFCYPYCSQALEAEPRSVPLAQGSRAVFAKDVLNLDSCARGHRFTCKSAQRNAPHLGSRSECTLLCCIGAPHENHEVI